MCDIRSIFYSLTASARVLSVVRAGCLCLRPQPRAGNSIKKLRHCPERPRIDQSALMSVLRQVAVRCRVKSLEPVELIRRARETCGADQTGAIILVVSLDDVRGGHEVIPDWGLVERRTPRRRTRASPAAPSSRQARHGGFASPQAGPPRGGRDRRGTRWRAADKFYNPVGWRRAVVTANWLCPDVFLGAHRCEPHSGSPL